MMAPSQNRRSFFFGAATASVAGAVISRPGRTPAFAAAQNRIAQLEASAGGRLGIAAVATADGATVAHRAAERFAFCSTFKLLAVSAILKRSSVERGLLERRIAYTKKDVVTYSPITARHAGGGMTVADICAAALQYSDNTAANLMIRLLGGPPAVTAFARSIDDEEFRLDRWEPMLNEALPGDARDTTTPAAMMDDLRRLALGDLLAAAQRDRLITWMRGNMTGAKRIRAGVPAGWVVADKTGTGDYGTSNDIAVVWPPGKPAIVLAIYFTQHEKNARPRDDVVASAARIVVDSLG